MKHKKVFRKIIAVLLALMTVMSIATPAMAAEDIGTIYQIDLPRGSDSNKDHWGHSAKNYMSGWWTFEEYGHTTSKAVGDYEGNTCYCIEPGISLHTGDKMTQNGENYWDRYPDNQTIYANEIKAFVGRILQYGWTGRNDLQWNSHDASDRDEMGNMFATQGLIWEVIVGERDENFNKIDAHKYGKDNVMEVYSSQHPCYAEIMSHYRDIEAKVKQHTTIPSFCSKSQSSAQTIELKYKDGVYTASINDSKGVLSNFNFSTDAPNVKLTKNGNTLTISTTQPPTGTYSIKGEKIQSKRRALITWTDGVIGPNNGQQQDIVAYGQEVTDPVPAFIKFKVSAGNCKIVKTSEDGYKEGFNFDVTGPAGFKKSVTTDETGSWTLTNVPEGKYTVTEKLTEEQSRYVLPESQEVLVKAGQTATVSFNNELKRGSAQFVKSDLETDKEIESKDGIFGVYSWDKKAGDYERIEEMTYSDELQAYTTSDLPVTVKNDGKYKIFEEQAPTGYANPTKVEFEFTITEDGQIHHINDGTITNIPQKARVHIEKQGEVLDDFDFVQTEFGLKYSPIYTIKNLPGSVWEITALEDIVVNGDVKHKKGDVIQNITTTEEGATSEPLYLGKYRLKEIVSPDGFFIGSNEFEFELTYHDQSIDIYTEYFTAYNERQKLKVKLYKDIEENTYYPNPEAYQSMIFGVFSDEDIKDTNGNVILEKDCLVDCFGLNDSFEGISSTDLPCSTKWYVRELQTAEGYILNQNKYPFVFNTRPQDIPLTWIEINNGEPIVNEVIKGCVEILKKSDFDGKLLKDAEYGVFKESDDTQIATMITDSEGYAKCPVDLTYGGFYLQELKAPPHYYLDDTKHYFFIGAEGEEYVTLHYDFTDTPKIGHLIPNYSEKGISESKSPQTGYDPLSLWVPGILFIISGTTLLILMFHKKISKKKKR